MASASVASAPPPMSHTHSTPNIHSRSHFDDTRERVELTQPMSLDKSTSPENNIRTPPKVFVKKEPSSPEPPRHRPSKLNLISASSTNTGIIAQTPRTAKGSLTMHDLGMACLSPGLNVTDNAMREQLERSMNVRNAQRNIIESRLHRNVHPKDDRQDSPMGNGPITGKGKRRPPAGLSIVAPHHTQFANERIIQSAPLNQSFTVRRQAMLEARQERMANRLPPIADVVFGQDREEERSQMSARQPPQESERRSFFPNPLPSPRLAPPEQQPERPREYKSAEEAVASMSGGREDLLPRIVHYGVHQPPTPPSPMQTSRNGLSSLKKTTLTIPVPSDTVEMPPTNKRRRTGEFDTDRDVSMGSDSEEQDRAEAKRRKKEMFLSLMAQAFDLLHS